MNHCQLIGIHCTKYWALKIGNFARRFIVLFRSWSILAFSSELAGFRAWRNISLTNNHGHNAISVPSKCESNSKCSKPRKPLFWNFGASGEKLDYQCKEWNTFIFRCCLMGLLLLFFLQNIQQNNESLIQTVQPFIKVHIVWCAYWYGLKPHLYITLAIRFFSTL